MVLVTILTINLPLKLYHLETSNLQTLIIITAFGFFWLVIWICKIKTAKFVWYKNKISQNYYLVPNNNFDHTYTVLIQYTFVINFDVIEQ